MQPSIIFFDEIDGLAPVRSSRQDQIHNSIVSTLLALMDGLDSRGQIVVIGLYSSPFVIVIVFVTSQHCFLLLNFNFLTHILLAILLYPYSHCVLIFMP